MNIEQLCRTVKERWSEIKNKRKAIWYLIYQFELLAWKKQKLKLGAIVFEIKEVKFDNTVLWEDIEIRFIRQDTTEDDYRKLENILKRLGWQWDAKNIIALSTVIIGFISYFIAYLRLMYYKYLPTLAFRADHFDFVIKFGFESTLTPYATESVAPLFRLNYWMVDVLTDFCVYFNIIF